MSTNISQQEAKERIFHILEIYPAVSPSMMNIAMNSVDSRVWKPVLEELLASGEIKSKTIYALTPIGRNQSYMIYYHPQFDYLSYYENFVRKPLDSGDNTSPSLETPVGDGDGSTTESVAVEPTS